MSAVHRVNGTAADYCAYERFRDSIVSAINLCEGEHLLVRRPFRWNLDGENIANGYEMFEVAEILRMLAMEIVESYGEHLFIVKAKPLESEAL